jgi:DNA polymerase-3 subunit delta
MSKQNLGYSSFTTSIKGYGKKVSTQAPSHITIAWGTSDYFLFKISKTAKSLWSQHGDSPVLVHEGQNLAKEGLSSLFEQAGLFAQKSLHIVRRAEKIKDLGKKLEKLGELNPSNHIIFCVETNRKPTKLFKVLAKFNPTEVPCFPPKTREMQNFLFDLYKDSKLNVEQKATQLILQAIGEDLFNLENAVQKISMEYAYQETPITYNQIASSIGVMREDHAFKLVNHIIEGKSSKAQILIEDLLERGTEPLSILGIIARHVRNAIQLSGHQPEASYLPAFVKKQYSSYLRRVSQTRLKQALIVCQRIDQSLKSNQKISPSLQLSSLLSII